MKNKLTFFISILYMVAFLPFFITTLGLSGSASSYLYLLVDIIIFYLGISGLNKNKFNLIMFVILVICSFFTYLIHDYSFLSHINGLREVINIILIFSFFEEISATHYKYLLDRKILFFIQIFLVVQIPVAFFQFLQHGAGDFVGGSLGVGNSGILTLVTILMVYFLIKKSYKRLGYKAYLNAIFLFPLFINETKISFILIPIMFLFLSGVKNKSRMFISVLGAGLFFLLLINFYSDRGKTMNNPFEEIFSPKYLDQYLLGPDAPTKKDQIIDVPRFTKIILTIKLIDKKFDESLLGIQYGAFKGGKVLDESSFSKRYHWLLLGSRPYFFYLLITGGWLLLFIITIYILKKIFSKNKILPDKNFALLCCIIFIVVLFYNDSIRDQFFIIMFAYFIVYNKGHDKFILWKRIRGYRIKSLELGSEIEKIQ